jgi:hypothetical protein
MSNLPWLADIAKEQRFCLSALLIIAGWTKLRGNDSLARRQLYVRLVADPLGRITSGPPPPVARSREIRLLWGGSELALAAIVLANQFAPLVGWTVVACGAGSGVGLWIGHRRFPLATCGCVGAESVSWRSYLRAGLFSAGGALYTVSGNLGLRGISGVVLTWTAAGLETSLFVATLDSARSSVVLLFRSVRLQARARLVRGRWAEALNLARNAPFWAQLGGLSIYSGKDPSSRWRMGDWRVFQFEAVAGTSFAKLVVGVHPRAASTRVRMVLLRQEGRRIVHLGSWDSLQDAEDAPSLVRGRP